MNSLFVAWHSTHPGSSWGPVGRLEFDGVLYRFYYTKGATSLSGFQSFDGMLNLDEIYESQEIFPLFKNRLLADTRPEYESFLTWSGFDPQSPPEPLVLLGVTEGIRQTDSVEVFPCPVPDDNGCYLNRFFLHGIRWAPHAAAMVQKLNDNEALELVPEPDNEVDPNAVAIYGRDTKIGYAPRYLANDMTRLLRECEPQFIGIVAQRVNHQAPLQQRVLCRMRACWPFGFQPCSDESFQPIPDIVPSS